MQSYAKGIVDKLNQQGFKLATIRNNNVHVKVIDQAMYVVVLADGRSLEQVNLARFNNNILLTMQDGSYRDVRVLNILFITSDNMDMAQEIIRDMSNVWLINVDDGKLFIFDNQPFDFAGLATTLDNLPPLNKSETPSSLIKAAPVTFAIIGANVVIFLLSLIWHDVYGDSVLSSYMCNNVSLVFEHGEYYRIFTAMFYHFGFMHLFGNMLMLYAMGIPLEKQLGHMPFAIAYAVTGCFASICSLANCMYGSANYDYSAGASGAIFGLLGILIIFAIYKRGAGVQFALCNLLLLVIINILNGYTSAGVDNAAHLGGLLAGLVAGLLFMLHNNVVVNDESL